jgi:hypothetical protein
MFLLFIFRGVINLHNKTYVIQPLIGGDEGVSLI